MPDHTRDEDTETRTLSVGIHLSGRISSVSCPTCPGPKRTPTLHATECNPIGSAQDYHSSGTDKSGHDWSSAYKAWGIKWPFKQSRADHLNVHKATQHSVTTFGGSNATSACNRIIEDGVIVASTTGDGNAGSSKLASSCQLQSRDLPSRRLLGKGLSGIGYETTWNGERFARKDFIGVPRDVFEEEAAVLVGLKDHMNVVKTHGWTADKRSCSLVLDLMDDDLLSLLQKRTATKQDLTGVCSGGQSSTSTVRQPHDNLSEALDTMWQIARGMECLHEQGVAHGDLKTKNILVTNGDQTWKLVKVTDFGLVRTKRKSKSNVSRQVRKLDIVKWKAPEYLEILFRQLILSNNEEGSTSSESDSNSESEESSSPSVVNVKLRRPDVFAADIYSFAVTCSQILTGKDPYPDLGWKDLGDKILSGLRPILPDACPPLLRNLLMSCWGDPAQRPTFSKIRKGLEYHDALPTTDFPVDTVVEKPTKIIPSLELTKSDDINVHKLLPRNDGEGYVADLVADEQYRSSHGFLEYPLLDPKFKPLLAHAVSEFEKDENEKKKVEAEKRDYESASESSWMSTMELQPISVGMPWSRQASVQVPQDEDCFREATIFEGVRYCLDRKTWVAEMRPPMSKEMVSFGEFKSQTEAAHAVDAAFYHYGERYMLNFETSTELLATAPSGLGVEDKLEFVKNEALWLAYISSKNWEPKELVDSVASPPQIEDPEAAGIVSSAWITDVEKTLGVSCEDSTKAPEGEYQEPSLLSSNSEDPWDMYLESFFRY